MGRKQKLKAQRRIEEQKEKEENKKKKSKTIKTAVISVLVIFAVYQVGIALNNNRNAENNSVRENIVGDKSQNDSTQSIEPTNQEPADNGEENNAGKNENIQNKIAIIETDKGDIKLELFTKDAPKTVENFVRLASEKFYDGVKFHRVDQTFMIQGGDPISKGEYGKDFIYYDEKNPNNLAVAGTGNPGYSFEDEINPWSLGLPDKTIANYEAEGYKYNKNLVSHKMDIGSLAMANSGPNTNGSQFFIVTERAQPHLNGRHTVFGKVIEGMDVVRKIQQGDVMKRVYISD